jgi:hypothetical protein
VPRDLSRGVWKFAHQQRMHYSFGEALREEDLP